MIYAVTDQSMESKFKRVSIGDVLDYFTHHDEIQVDTETDGRDPHKKRIITAQFGDTENQFVVDTRITGFEVLKPLLKNRLVLLHNASFDYKFFKAVGITIEYIYDTMLAECVIFNGYDDWGYALADLAKRYLDIELEKETRGEFHKLGSSPLSDRQILYAGTDVKYLQPIRDKQKAYIDKYDLQYAVSLENNVVKALSDIEFNGMYLDPEAWMKLAKDKEQQKLQCEIELDDYLIQADIGYRATGEQDLFGQKMRKLKINYNSPPQTLDMLRKCGLPVNDTNDNTLQQYRDWGVVQKLTAVREASKKVSTYGKSFLDYINDATGRIHTDFWQMKNTFRLGSGNKKTNAPNVQNIPSEKEYRNCFKPRSGYKWLSLDYSGQELRLMADFSEEWAMIDAMNDGKDPHCFVGSMMYGKEIKKGDPERNEAKSINFGKPYGMGAYKLAAKLNISEEEAEKKLAMHERAFPDLDRWLKQRAAEGKQKGYGITNSIHKGRRWFPYLRTAIESRQSPAPDWSLIYRIEGSVERVAMNLPIQGSGAIIMKEALVAARDIIKNYDAYLICTVHDQLDVEVREDQAQELFDKLKQSMEEIGNKYVQHVTMPVDGKILDKWEK